MINAQLQASGLEILDRDQLVAELETIEGTSDGYAIAGPLVVDEEAPLPGWSGYSGRLRRLLGRFSAGVSARRPW
jgi:hypothetical protein